MVVCLIPLHEIDIGTGNEDELQIEGLLRHLYVPASVRGESDDFRLQGPNFLKALLQLAELLEAGLSGVTDVEDQHQIPAPEVVQAHGAAFQIHDFEGDGGLADSRRFLNRF